MKLRPLFVLLLACGIAWFSASAVIAQSQGVGLTVEGPAASPGASSAPSPTAGSPSGGTTVPVSSSGENNGTVVQGTTTTPGGSGTGGPLPRTGVDILRLLAIGLGLITVGQVVLRAGRVRVPRRLEPLSPGPRGR